MALSTAEWHQRYLQQARWTENMRSYLYKKADLKYATRIIDLGCGTGVLERELLNYTSIPTFALDINPAPLKFAQEYASNSVYTQADVLSLPFADRTFDLTFCHFLLLWVKLAYQAVNEMARVTRPNGYVLALAEPDYGGRIDYPPELSKIGAWQSAALNQQGANPEIGRELRSIFTQAGMVNIEVGVMGGQWGPDSADLDQKLEWDVINSDLCSNSEFLSQADKLEALDRASRAAYQRILFVPTFYALGRIKG